MASVPWVDLVHLTGLNDVPDLSPAPLTVNTHSEVLQSPVRTRYRRDGYQLP